MTCIPLILCIFSVFLSIFDVFSKSNILTMSKPRKIIGPVFDRGLLRLSKNLKTFDLNSKLREEMRLRKTPFIKKMPIWTNFVKPRLKLLFSAKFKKKRSIG